MYEYIWNYMSFLKYIFNAACHIKWKGNTGQQCIDQILDGRKFLVLVQQENRKRVSYLEIGMLQISLQISILVYVNMLLHPDMNIYLRSVSTLVGSVFIKNYYN